jgi:hypothetical protein
VSSDWVDITHDGVPDVYQRTRWYSGCTDGYVAEVRFWGPQHLMAAKKAGSAPNSGRPQELRLRRAARPLTLVSAPAGFGKRSLPAPPVR